jgi:hypothetical protein
MADKILRITFNGVSTLTPGLPGKGEANPEKAFVLMAANRSVRKNTWKADIDPHTPFIYVPVAAIGGDVPRPAESVVDDKLGPCNIYFVDHARVVFDPEPMGTLEYYVDPDPERKRGVRPGSSDVIRENDIRWLMDINEIIPDARVSAAADPRSPTVVDEVAVVVELRAGLLKANFPCKTAQPKTFRDRDSDPVPDFRRVLAAEFFIEMRFPEDTQSVALRLQRLRARAADASRDQPPAGIAGDTLILQWGDRTAIDLRMGNDTRRETRALVSFKRCDIRTRDVNGHPVAVPRDEDFELHYQVLEFEGAARPLPQNGPHQTQFDHCSPLATRSNGG